MARHRDSESEDRELIWQIILAAVVVVAIGLAWPHRYKPPYPWTDPVFDAVLWSTLFVVICTQAMAVLHILSFRCRRASLGREDSHRQRRPCETPDR